MKEYNENEMERKDVVSEEKMEETKTETVGVKEPKEKAEESQISEILDEMDEDSNRSAKVVAVIVGAAAVVIIAIIIALLVSSGKKNQEETTSVSSVEQQETTTKETEKEVEEVVTTPKPTVEPTPEPTPTPKPTPEPIVYEGIDMESTLPGKEWIDTFEGIIEEPKFVVFNDETNKKVIVENRKEVEFEEGDTLAAFAPAGLILATYDGKGIKELIMYNGSDAEVVFNEGDIITPNTISIQVYDLDANKVGEIVCTLIKPKE